MKKVQKTNSREENRNSKNSRRKRREIGKFDRDQNSRENSS